GKDDRVKVKGQAPGEWTGPISVIIPMTCFENTHPKMATMAKTSAASQNIRCANAQVSCFDLPRKYPVKTGMNDAPNAPSPVMRRIMLGMRKAKMNESATGDVPSRRATRWSRKYPQIRLITVIRATTEADF